MDRFTSLALDGYEQAEQDPVIADVLLRRLCAYVKAGRYHNPGSDWHPQDDAQFNRAYHLMLRRYPIAAHRLEGVLCACKFQIRDVVEEPPPASTVRPVPVETRTPASKSSWWHAVCAALR